MNLNSGWQFRGVGKDTFYPAEVPGTVHTDLERAGLIDDPFYRSNERDLQWIGKTDWEYQTYFQVDDALLSKERIEIVFKGLDTYATVFLNDTLVLEADNMFRQWLVDCKSQLVPGRNQLRIHFRSSINEILPQMQNMAVHLPAINDHGEKTSPYTRKAPYHFGWDWGPRFVTCGIWQDVYLQAWDKIIIRDLHIKQIHLDKSVARVTAVLEIESTGNGLAKVKLDVKENASLTFRQEITVKLGIQTHRLDLSITNPKLWWPNGYGDQPLYTIAATVTMDSTLSNSVSRRIGLRQVELVQRPDSWGKSFEFVVNGLPVFAKGGNWIPADNFINRVDRNRYEQLLGSVRDANMNMIRVWGGGIYEQHNFYEVCDELGIMVWQDFMFSCSMYPADERFLANIEQEAIYQVKRLRNHPCIVLWCGNNEIEGGWLSWWGWQGNLPESFWDDYLKIFHGVLPKVCAAFDPSRPYWPSSPSSNREESANAQSSGDVHYWGVWHASEAFSEYLKQTPRFMSEYGFQSFPELKTIQRFALPGDYDLESEVMVTHQKHPRGNPLIREYLLREFPEPKDFASFIYLSQVIQAEGLKLGSEHYRRIRPQCMGALYWQINDCWPVASWASIDYFGRWKALHYYAKKFFVPVLVSPHLAEDRIEIFVVSDRTEETACTLQVQLLSFAGKVERKTSKKIRVQPLASKNYLALNQGEWIPVKDSSKAFLFVELKQGEKTISTNVLFFEPIKNLNLPAANIDMVVTKSKKGFAIKLESDLLARNVFLSMPKTEGFFTDNYFNVIPGYPVEIAFLTEEQMSLQAFKDELNMITLVDAFKEK